MGDWGGTHAVTDVGGKRQKSHKTCRSCQTRKPVSGSGLCKVCQKRGMR